MQLIPPAPAQRADSPALGARLMAAALALPMLAPVAAVADSAPDRGLVALKHLDYLDSQPGKDRIRVRAPSLQVLAPIGADWSIGGTLISDAISGASPAYHSSALGKLRDERNAGDLTITRYLPNGSLALGLNVSKEKDYLSRGFSLQASRSSEDKNTTWTAGIGFNSDAINPSNRTVSNESKKVTALLAGVTQVMGPRDIVQLNVTHNIGRGYFSDPYKVFDNRPRERNQSAALLRWNHHFEGPGSTLRSSYRYYTDSFGLRAHTLGLELVQPIDPFTGAWAGLGSGWSVTPSLRLYTQSAARFYVDADPSTAPFPPNPPEGAVYFSEDHRVSAFGAHTWGLKLAKQINADWQADVKFERYGQRAAWRFFGTGSPGLQPFKARSVLLGVSRQF